MLMKATLIKLRAYKKKKKDMEVVGEKGLNEAGDGKRG